MISQIRGILAHRAVESIVVDVQGVGFELQVPLSTFSKLPPQGQEVKLQVYTLVREDAIQLHGFLTIEERQAFKLLLAVNGVGPKVAQNILSGLSVPELASACSSRDVARLSRAPGVGKKTAERIALELQGKMTSLLAGQDPSRHPEASRMEDDVLSALVNMEVARTVADRVLSKALQDPTVDRASFDSLFRAALKALKG